MRLVKRLGGAPLGAAMLIGCGPSAPSARAGYIVTMLQDGLNVVAQGSGKIDLSGLTLPRRFSNVATISPHDAVIFTGPTVLTPADVYHGSTGPMSFGSRGSILADSGSGDFVGLNGPSNFYVPAGYASGHFLSDSATYDNQTFASLGVTPGTYKWTWGTGPNQNFTLDIVTAVVPEPSSLALLVLPLGLVALAAARPRRPARDAWQSLGGEA